MHHLFVKEVFMTENLNRELDEVNLVKNLLPLEGWK